MHACMIGQCSLFPCIQRVMQRFASLFSKAGKAKSCSQTLFFVEDNADLLPSFGWPFLIGIALHFVKVKPDEKGVNRQYLGPVI
jgi:hypothetical protein